jgi:hypothetical protein
MSYIPSEEAMSMYEQPKQSFGSKYLDYLQGAGTQLLQSGSNAGRELGMLPSYGYEALTGNKGYTLAKSPDLSEFIPKSESGQIGKNVGELASEAISHMVPAHLAYRGLRTFSRYHPLTKGQMGRQFQEPINAAHQAGVRAPLSYRQLQEMNQLLSHPALEAGGGAGRSLTAMGRGSLIEGGAQGRIPALHSAQSLLGDLERLISRMGESELASTRVRPMKEQILDAIQNSMREGGLTEEAGNYQNARQAARRYYRTRAAIKKVAKPLSLASLIKAGMSAAKSLP